jgi:hypothetical protein
VFYGSFSLATIQRAARGDQVSIADFKPVGAFRDESFRSS